VLTICLVQCLSSVGIRHPKYKKKQRKNNIERKKESNIEKKKERKKPMQGGGRVKSVAVHTGSWTGHCKVSQLCHWY